MKIFAYVLAGLAALASDGCSEPATSEPAGPSAGFVSQQEYQQLQERFDELLAKYRDKSEVDQLADAQSRILELEAKLEAIQPRQPSGLGMSIEDFAESYNEEKNWQPTLLQKTDNGIQLAVTTPRLPELVVMAGGPAGDLQSLAFVLGGNDDQLMVNMFFAISAIEKIAPWKATDLGDWIEQAAIEFDRGGEAKPIYRRDYRLASGSLMGRFVIHLSRGGAVAESDAAAAVSPLE